MITAAEHLGAERSGGRTRAGRADYIAFAVAILSVVAFGSLNLFLPFTGDTALFSLGAEAIDRGELLYVDFWDNKQPGIYWFFLAGGWLFGFDETGARLFELLWWLIFVVISIPLLRPCFRNRWLGSLALALPVCTYFAAASPWMATQVEALTAGPIVISGLLLLRPTARNRSWNPGHFLAGVFAAITVTFKLAFAPLFVVFVLFASRGIASDQVQSQRLRAILRMWIGFTIGVLTVLGVVCIPFAASGGLDEMLWTSFVYPGEAITNSKPAPYDRLVQIVYRLAVVLGPWSPAILLSLVSKNGAPTEPDSRRDLIRLMWVWLIVGAVILLIQRFSWWSYHATVLFYPGCILAVCGIDAWLKRVAKTDSTTATRFTLVLLALTAPGILAAAYQVRRKAPQFVRILRKDGDQQWRHHTDSEEYSQGIEIADAFERLSPSPGRIYVFGNPLIYQFTNREQALPIHGWAWEFFLDEQWEALPDQLRQHKPPYIFCTPSYLSLVRKKSSAAYEVLRTDYAAAAETTTGVWYAHRSVYDEEPLR